MADVGLVQLGSLRLQAQQRADMVNSSFLSTTEWNQNLGNSYKELYDLLITLYGNDYNVAAPYAFTTTSNTQLYALPDGLTTTDASTGLVAVPFYKLIGVDLKVTTSPDSWVTLRRFEFTERNKYWLANQYAIYGIVTLRYRIEGSKLWLTPVPSGTQTIQLWYIPKPTNLQATVTCATTSGSGVITTSDTSQLAVGQNVSDTALAQGATAVVPANATIGSISTNVSFTLAAAATCTATKAVYLISAWADGTTLDGISGWEEYVVIDAALKAAIKEESSHVQELMAQKEAMRVRIISSAEGRDASLPSRVTDTASIDLGWPGNGGWDGGQGGW